MITKIRFQETGYTSSKPVGGSRLLLLAWLIFLGCLTAQVLSKDGGEISGRVTDEMTGQSLAGANLELVNSLIGASTDDGGRYRIVNVPPGTWELRVSYIGYSPKQVTLTVEKDSLYRVDFSIKPSAVLFDQVVITGSRQAEDLNEAVNSVDVLPSSEIVLRNRLRMDDALQQLPAVDLLSENLSVRGGTGYSFLGVGGSRVLMLIDDVPMLTSDFGRANWDFLPVTELERAEVLKGAASVLYGSGGISGVVNLITRQPTLKPRFAFRSSAGVYDDPSVAEWKWTDRTLYFHRSDFSYGQTFGPLGLRFSISRYYTTGYRENSDISRWYFTARPVINFKDGSRLSLFLAYNREERGLFFLWRSQNKALSSEFRDRAEVDGVLVSAIYNKIISPTLMTMVRLSINSQLLGLPLSLTEGFNPALGMSGEIRGIWLLNKKHSITLGLDYRHDVAESDFFGSHTANTFSPYIQDTWKVSDVLQINAGVRYDHYSLVSDTAETQLSPKLGVSYQLFSNTILHSSVGRGFRAPTIAERFTEHDLQQAAQLLKNPDLQPERAMLFDIGIRQRFSNNFSAEVAGFFSDYRNLIELTQISELNLILQFRNCPRAWIRGIESQVKLQLFDNHLNLLMNGTWMHSESLENDRPCNHEEGESLPYRPKFSAFFSPAVTFGPLTFEGEYRYISRFDRVSFFPNEERVAQKVLNLRTRLHWKQFMILFQVKNAINHNHTVVEQNIDEIRNFSVAIAGEF